MDRTLRSITGRCNIAARRNAGAEDRALVGHVLVTSAHKFRYILLLVINWSDQP